MSKYNELISDAEIRELLNRVVLEDDVLHEQLVNMEAHIVFAAEPAIVPPLHMEQKLVSRLGAKFAAKTGLKWMFTGIGVATAVTYIGLKSYAPGEQVSKNTMPAGNSTALVIPGSDTAKTWTPAVTDSQTVAEPVNIASPADQDPSPMGLPQQSRNRSFEALPPAAPIPHRQPGNARTNSSEDVNIVSMDTFFKGVKRLEVNATMCDVNVDASKVETVSVKGQLKIEMKGIYSKRSDFGFFYERKDDLLKVWVENRGGKNVLIAGVANYEGFLNFVVPEETDVVLNNSSGDIKAKGLNGNVCDVHTSYGDISISDTRVPMTLKAVSGNITVTQVKGDVSASTGYGEQNFTDVTGNLKIQSSSGNVKADNNSGDVSVTSNYGDINLKKINGIVKLVSLSGNIQISDMAGTQCHITSNYGDIKMDRITAPVEIDSRSGNTYINSLAGDATVKSSYGNQEFTGVRGNITAKSTSGSIKISNSEGNMVLALAYGDASVNDSKGDLKVSSASGNIRGNNLELMEKMDLAATYGNVNMHLKNSVNDLSFNLSTVSGHIKINKDGIKRSDDSKLVIEKGKIKVRVVTTSGDQIFD